MKKNISFSVAFVALFAQSLFAQEQEPALAKVHYHFMHINDTAAKDQYHDEELVLYLGQQASYYTSYQGKRMEEQVNKQMDDPAFDGSLTIRGKGSGSSNSYYSNPSKQLFQMVQSVGGVESYVIDEGFPALDWKITEESKEIGGYACQKATVHFKGRDYAAWFTTEIPFQSGPWKLQGLPGLVLEASDSKHEVVFEYAGFDKMDDQALLVGLPKGAIKTDEKTIEKKEAAFKKNPEAYMKARAQGGGEAGVTGSIFGKADVSRVKSINVERDGVQKSKITNNPIELTAD